MLSSDNEPDIDREKKAISHTDLAILLPEIDEIENDDIIIDYKYQLNTITVLAGRLSPLNFIE